jgi:hypothetical protein
VSNRSLCVDTRKAPDQVQRRVVMGVSRRELSSRRCSNLMIRSISARYFLSDRIKTLKAIRAKIGPEPAREPLPPPPKPYAPPRASAAKRRRGALRSSRR